MDSVPNDSRLAQDALAIARVEAQKHAVANETAEVYTDGAILHVMFGTAQDGARGEGKGGGMFTVELEKDSLKVIKSYFAR